MTTFSNKTAVPATLVLLAIFVVMVAIFSQSTGEKPPYQTKERENNKYPAKITQVDGRIAGTILASDPTIYKTVESPDKTIKIDFAVKDVSSTTPFEKEVGGIIYFVNGKEIPETTIDLALLNSKGEIMGEMTGVLVIDGEFKRSMEKDWGNEVAGVGFDFLVPT